MRKLLQILRRWSGRAEALPGWPEMVAWARDNGWLLRRTIDGDGWAMSRHAAHPGVRIEWGPSQRRFMSRHELRVRLDTDRWGDAQVLVLDRPLAARMDHEVYARATDGVRTEIDDELPEEMRWLAMHGRVPPGDLGLLRERYNVVANDPGFAALWLDGPVADALQARAEAVTLDASTSAPLMLRLARGRLVLRQAADLPDAAMLARSLQIIEGARHARGSPGSTQPMAEPSGLMPEPSDLPLDLDAPDSRTASR